MLDQPHREAMRLALPHDERNGFVKRGRPDLGP
jgi:hypothetical protein